MTIIKKKKCSILAAIIAVVLIFSPIMQIPALAAIHPNDTEAKALKNLGIILGDESGFALDRNPTRVEASVILLRLLGKESIASTTPYEHPFDDVPDWADSYIGYLYHFGLTKGISETQFGNSTVTANQMMTFILRALGYSDSEPATDF